MLWVDTCPIYAIDIIVESQWLLSLLRVRFKCIKLLKWVRSGHTNSLAQAVQCANMPKTGPSGKCQEALQSLSMPITVGRTLKDVTL